MLTFAGALFPTRTTFLRAVVFTVVFPHFRSLMVLALIGFALRGIQPLSDPERSANNAFAI